MLRDLLPDAVRVGKVGPAAAQAFCLWASEWWRANHVGGPWRWEDLLTELGVGTLAPNGGSYPLLCTMVTAGLTGWRRPLLRTGHGRAFLVTLACEGGLPLKLLAREQASLRRYFQAVLEEFRVYAAAHVPEQELAARAGDRLSRGLRHEVVYELTGRLIAQVRALQAEIGDSRTPVATLDEKRPEWRSELPLRLTDQVAETLLNGLLLDARAVARGGATQVRWSRWIEEADGEWGLAGELRLPLALDPVELSGLFPELRSPAPARFDLALRSDGGVAVTLALGTVRRIADQPHVVLERLSGRTGVVRGPVAARGRALVLGDAAGQTETRRFSGAASLSDLPWVWSPVAGTPRYELAGQGSANVPSDHAMVAVPAGTRPEATEGEGTCTPAGMLRGLDREVFRVSGMVAFQDPDAGESRVRTGVQQPAAASEFFLHGVQRDISRDGIPVFLGSPNLLERTEDGSLRRVCPGAVQWKAAGTTGGWAPLSADSVGEGRVRYAPDGRTRYSVRARLLPAGARIRFVPNWTAAAGEIELTGLNGAAVRLLGPPGLDWETTGSGGVDRLAVRVEGTPPENVEVELDWGARGRLRISLPFPALGAGFRTARGEVLAHGSELLLGRLSGIRAYAMVPGQGAEFFVEGTYLGSDHAEMQGVPRSFRVPMESVDSGRSELDLGRVEREVRLRLARSADPTGTVRLHVSSATVARVPQPVIRAAAFDLAFEAVAPGAVRIVSASGAGLPENDSAALRVDAVPLSSPEREPLRFERDTAGCWRAPVQDMEPGPWLVFGRDGDLLRVRPLVLLVRATEVAGDAGRIATVYVDAGTTDAADGLRQVVHALAADAGHRDWPAVFGLARLARQVPASSLELLRSLVTCPEAAALAALRAGPDDLPALWSALETLPFWWRLVPRHAWKAAVARLADGFRAELGRLPAGIVGDPSAAVDESVSAAIRRVAAELGCLEPVLALAHATHVGKRVPDRAAALFAPAFRHLLFGPYRGLIAAPPGFAPGAVPEVDGFDSLVEHLSAGGAGAQLLAGGARGRNNLAYRTILLAPAVTALAALTDAPLSSAQRMQLRAVAELDFEWFSDAHHHAYLYAIGDPQPAAAVAARA